MFGVGLVRDLIVLPTEPPVEDRHLALVSPRSTKDPSDFELVLRLHAIPHVMKVFPPPEKSEVVAVHHAPNVASLVVEHSRGCHLLREAPVHEGLRVVFLPSARGWPHAVQPTSEPPALPVLALPVRRQHECRLVILELAIKVGFLDVNQHDLLLAPFPVPQLLSPSDRLSE